MRRAFLFCLCAASACAQADPQATIEKIRSRALQYVAGLPNFVCTQVTLRHIDTSATAEKWKLIDTIEEDLSYFDRGETYKLLRVNGKPPRPAVNKDKGETLRSKGEFGSLMHRIFSAESRADFKWERLDTLRGRSVQVLSYRVAKENSNWVIRNNNLATVTAYHGLVFADSTTDSVLRATLINEMPERFPVHEAGMEIDYDFKDISGRKYLLPVQSISEVRRGKTLLKNTIRFSKYRKFASDTEIKFDTPSEPPIESKKNN